MTKLRSLLICDDQPSFHYAIKSLFKDTFEVKSAYNGDEAFALIKNNSFDIVLLDIQMRTPDEGLVYLKKFLEFDPELHVVMNSGKNDFTTVLTAMKSGAKDFISKDEDPGQIVHRLKKALEEKISATRNKTQNNEVARAQKSHLLLGESPGIIELKKNIAKIKKSKANVLIFGETGTGKEVVARQLRGELADGTLTPFIAIDSSTIQSTMAESILFGFEKGAFTGADRSQKGIFEEADGGCVYFDELANMPLEIQMKLLRVLQEKEVARLGSTRTIPLDFRVISATNQDLDTLEKNGKFKHDLIQRLNVLPLSIPPLRERKEDISILVDHFCKVHSGGDEKSTFSREALEMLQSYNWPGNIRELSNVVAYVTTMADQSPIEVADLPPKFRELIKEEKGESVDPQSPRTFYDLVGEQEKIILAKAYKDCQANISKLALTLGMDRSHLYTKLKEHHIHPVKS